jgi:hypothetical protein
VSVATDEVRLIWTLQPRKKKLPLGALIVHLNDAHHWTRERIAAWVADPDVPQDESHAHR